MNNRFTCSSIVFEWHYGVFSPRPKISEWYLTEELLICAIQNAIGPFRNTIQSSTIQIQLNGIPSTIQNTSDELHSMIDQSMVF